MEKISGSRIFGGKKNRFKPEQDDPLEITFAVSVGFCSAGEEIPQFCPEGRGAKQPERFFKVRVLRCYEEAGVLCLYSFTVISVDLDTLVQVQERIPLGDGPGAGIDGCGQKASRQDGCGSQTFCFFFIRSPPFTSPSGGIKRLDFRGKRRNQIRDSIRSVYTASIPYGRKPGNPGLYINSYRKPLDNQKGRQYNETIQTIWNPYKLFVIPYSSPCERCPIPQSGCLRISHPGSFLQSF